jgi:non-ribosomal peptide synthetase component F
VGRVEPDRPITVGRPIANLRATVVDRHGHLAPVGLFGELHLAGPGVAGDGPLATGDRARWLPAGVIELA